MYGSCTTLSTDAETYSAIEEHALAEGPPAGLLAHVAGEVAEGWRIIDVWESEQHWQRFASGALARAVELVTGQAPAGPAGPSSVLTVRSDAQRVRKVGLAPASLQPDATEPAPPGGGAGSVVRGSWARG